MIHGTRTTGKMAPAAQGPFDAVHFLKGGIAGGICCSVTHGALCPVDVVKTRIQLDPVKYNRGMIGGFGQVIKVRFRGCFVCSGESLTSVLPLKSTQTTKHSEG